MIIPIIIIIEPHNLNDTFVSLTGLTCITNPFWTLDRYTVSHTTCKEEPLSTRVSMSAFSFTSLWHNQDRVHMALLLI